MSEAMWFKNQVHYLQGLAVEIYLEPLRSLRNEGFGKSILQTIKKLNKEVGYSISDEYIFNELGLSEVWKNEEVNGGTYMIRTFNAIIDDLPVQAEQIIIIYKSSGNYVLDLMFQGHEETHALQRLGMLSILESVAHMDICDNLHKEVIASIGGLIALERHGINIEDSLNLADMFAGPSSVYIEYLREAALKLKERHK